MHTAKFRTYQIKKCLKKIIPNIQPLQVDLGYNATDGVGVGGAWGKCVIQDPLVISDDACTVRQNRLVGLFNTELSTKRYWWGPKSQEVGEEGDYT